jgi:hypothetical protein
MPFQSVSVKIAVPVFGGPEISGTWAPDRSQRQAAWEMYVELVTRISVEKLGPEQGLLREALTSLYSLFSSTREILRRYGPAVARTHRGASESFASIAVAVLNRVLRPLLEDFHPSLEEYEAGRPEHVSKAAWERDWPRAKELRGALDQVALSLTQYANELARVAKLSPIHGRPGDGGA